MNELVVVGARGRAPAPRGRGANPAVLGVSGRRLPPLVRRFGEQLDRGGADRRAARRRLRDAALRRHVRAEQVAGKAPRLQPHGSSVNARREISGTNRTPPARRATRPAGPRSSTTSSWEARSPTGITSRPP